MPPGSEASYRTVGMYIRYIFRLLLLVGVKPEMLELQLSAAPRAMQNKQEVSQIQP